MLRLPLCEETLKLCKARLGPEDPNTLISMDILAGAYAAAGKLDLALPLSEEALTLWKSTLGPEHPETLNAMHSLAAAYQSAGKLDLALPLFEETLRLRKARLGPEHPATRTSLSALAMAYQAAGKPDLALPLLEETLKLTKAKVGPDDLVTLSVMNDLAQAYQSAGKPDLALPLLEETLKLTKGKVGLDDLATLNSMSNLARAYQAAGKHDLALPLFEETLKLFKAKFGPEHLLTRMSMRTLALGYLAAAAHQAWFGQDKELAATCERALELAKESNDPTMLERVAKACSLRPTEDASARAVALDLARNAVKLGKGHQLLPWFQLSLGMAEYRSSHFAEADAALADMTSGDTSTAAFYRAMSLFRQGKLDEARQVARSAAANMKPLPKNEKTPLADNADHDDLIRWLAYKEAKELVGSDATPDAAPRENASPPR